MSANDGGQAFPLSAMTGDPRDGVYCQNGMSLRDYFAGQALVGLVAWRSLKTIEQQEENADRCYSMADAMLKARAK